MFIPASRSCSSAVRYEAGSAERVARSSGVQQTPRQNTGTPLTTRPKPWPSASRSTSMVRKPTRPRSMAVRIVSRSAEKTARTGTAAGAHAYAATSALETGRAVAEGATRFPRAVRRQEACSPPAASHRRCLTGDVARPPGANNSRGERRAAPLRYRRLGADVVRPRSDLGRSRSGLAATGRRGRPAGTSPACGLGARSGTSAALVLDQARAPSRSRALRSPRAAGRERENAGRARCRSEKPRDIHDVRDKHALRVQDVMPFSQTSATVASPSKRSRGRARSTDGEPAAVPPVVGVEIARMIEIPQARSTQRRRHGHRPVARQPFRAEASQVPLGRRASGLAAISQRPSSGRAARARGPWRGPSCVLCPGWQCAVSQREAPHGLVPGIGHGSSSGVGSKERFV